MNYKIIIISTPGIQIKEDFISLLKRKNKNISVMIIRQEKIAMVDISELLRYFYQEFDGIFIITPEKAEYKSFQKIANETNRILSLRGLTDERIKVFSWDGKNYEILNDFIVNSFKNLLKIGPNPVKSEELEIQ